MPKGVHEQTAIQVWVDVDIGIADLVRYLNTIPGVRTHASCQGTIGEGGSSPYRAQVMTTWPDAATEQRLRAEFDVTELGERWGYIHPRSESDPADPRRDCPWKCAQSDLGCLCVRTAHAPTATKP